MPLAPDRKGFLADRTTLTAMLNFVKPTAQEEFHGYPIEKLKVPEGFEVSLYATVPAARSMALAPDGTLYVGTGGFSNALDRIYRLKDWNGNGKIDADEVEVIADGLNNPNGVAYRKGALYVAEKEQLLAFKGINKLPRGAKLDRTQGLVVHRFPHNDRHDWKSIRFAPPPNDNWLYASAGAPCRFCLTALPSQAAIHRINVTNDTDEVMAAGVRNSQGFDFAPVTNQLWFTDNGRDELGDDDPPDELNVLSKAGENFGWPHCHGNNVPDPQFPKEGACDTATKPAVALDPHAAALGMRFYRGTNFPSDRGNIFIAEHGSWNRTRKSGYQVVRVNSKNRTAEPFVTGWLDPVTESNWGRPVDIQELSDGSLLISDDGIPDTGFVGAIYQVKYVGKKN